MSDTTTTDPIIETDAAGVPLPVEPTEAEFTETLNESEAAFAAAVQDRLGIEPELGDPDETTDDGSAPPVDDANLDPDLDDTDPPANPGESTDEPTTIEPTNEQVAEVFEAVRLGSLEFATPEEMQVAENALLWLQSQTPDALQRMQDAASGRFGLVPLDPYTGQPVYTPPPGAPATSTDQSSGINDPLAIPVPDAIAALEESDPEIVAAFREQQAQIEALKADSQQRANVEMQAQLERNQRILDQIRDSHIQAGDLTMAECVEVENAVAAVPNLMDGLIAAHNGDLNAAFRAAYEEGRLRVPALRQRLIETQAEQIASARVAEDATILRENIDKKTRASSATSSSGSIVQAPVDLDAMTPAQRRQYLNRQMVADIAKLRRG